MRNLLLLAWRHVAHHRLRTGILALCIALTFLLPFAVHLLLERYGRALMTRAAATPLIAGAKGSQYDLVLNTLYFKGRIPNRLTVAEADRIDDSGLARAIPMLTGRTAQGHAVVGVSPDYFAYRGLAPAAGTLPLVLGDALLGARAAQALGVGVGGHVLTDRGSLYDLTMAYPLRMRVVGVIAATGTADDHAVFVGIKTAWVIEGIGHGHQAAAAQDANNVLRQDGDDVVLNAAVYEYEEITDANIAEFHFHGDPAELPLTAVIVLPDDARSATLLKGRYRVSTTAQLLVPTQVVDELLGLVFRVKVFFDANVALVSVATALFLVLIVLLTLKVRQREIETLFKLGCARLTVARLLALELLMVVLAGLAIAGGVAILIVLTLERVLLPGA